jgi:hypothetical protein
MKGTVRVGQSSLSIHELEKLTPIEGSDIVLYNVKGLSAET